MKPIAALSLALSLLDAAPAAAAGRREPVSSPLAASLKVGETHLANGAVAYRPRSAGAGATPLIVMLHGAQGYPLDFLNVMERQAERRGAVLLAPHSQGETWDLIENAAHGRDPWSGNDSPRLNQSLADLFAKIDIDRSRIVLLGFSDGASYALSLGLLNPRFFKTIVALSPGMALAPERIDPAQRLFIAHCRGDSILPFDNTSNQIVPTLRARGADLTFRVCSGDHAIYPAELDEALDFALGKPAN